MDDPESHYDVDEEAQEYEVYWQTVGYLKNVKNFTIIAEYAITVNGIANNPARDEYLQKKDVLEINEKDYMELVNPNNQVELWA